MWAFNFLWSLGVVCFGICAGESDGSSTSRSLEALRFVSGFFGLDAAHKRGRHAGQLTLIGAGFSRTGTKSLEAALLRLGHKVYDTRSMLESGHTSRWEDAAHEFRATGSTALLDQMLAEIEAQGYTATLDFPMNLFAPIFANRRPSAKVLMSVRPSEESWVEAWETINRILGIFVLRPWRWLIDMEFNKRILKTLYDFDFEYPVYPEHIWRPVPWFEVVQRFPAFESEAARGRWVQLHKRLQRELESQLPRERFRAFDVRSGWPPLLDFLGIRDASLAAEPFPRLNDRASLEAVRAVMDVLAAGLPLWLASALWLVSRCVGCCLRRSPRTATKEKPL